MHILVAPISLILTYYTKWTPMNRCYSSEFEDYGSPCSEEFYDDNSTYKKDYSCIHEIETIHNEFVENIKNDNETDSKTIDENSVYSYSGIPPWKYIQR